VTPERYSAAIETAAYVTVAEAITAAAQRGETLISVVVARAGDQLVVTVEDDGAPSQSSLLHLADRIGALGGSLEVESTTLRAEIPCV
jgi:signal transduction histidine kinase